MRQASLANIPPKNTALSVIKVDGQWLRARGYCTIRPTTVEGQLPLPDDFDLLASWLAASKNPIEALIDFARDRITFEEDLSILAYVLNSDKYTGPEDDDEPLVYAMTELVGPHLNRLQALVPKIVAMAIDHAESIGHARSESRPVVQQMADVIVDIADWTDRIQIAPAWLRRRIPDLGIRTTLTNGLFNRATKASLAIESLLIPPARRHPENLEIGSPLRTRANEITDRLPATTFADATLAKDAWPSSPATFWYHGGEAYSLDGQRPVSVSTAAHEVLQLFMTQPEDIPHSAKEIKVACPSCSNPSKTFANLIGQFGDTNAMRIPGKSGDRSGYYLRVQPISKD